METPVTAVQAPQPGGMSALRNSRQWSDLSPDMLLAVSARLHDPADFVRFNAVCTSWRERLHSAATRPKFPPWLLWPSNDGQIMHSPVVYSGHVEVSSEDAPSSHRRDYKDDIVLAAAAPSTGGGGRNWVASADGTAVWLFTGGPEPKLINLVTGTTKLLPPFPDDTDSDVIKRMRNPHGVVYGDGTVFLYSCEKGYGAIFTAAVLRPGEAAWAVVKKRLDRLANYCCAAYHDDKVLVWENLFWCCILDFQDSTDQYTSIGELKTPCREAEDRRHGPFCSYVLESRGELLRASILIEHEWRRHHYLDGPSPPLSVTVHTLEEGAGGEMQWAARDAHSLGDRILFLGSRASFGVDAAQLGIEGGCAYFIFMSRLYRCSLVNGEAKLVKPLRRGCCVWLRPQPAIAPVQKIREKLKALSKQEDDKS